tara:strand:+ start:170 stop:451 length:282 start_codon:yes stop_codon:yes gene_type:complete
MSEDLRLILEVVLIFGNIIAFRIMPGKAKRIIDAMIKGIEEYKKHKPKEEAKQLSDSITKLSEEMGVDLSLDKRVKSVTGKIPKLGFLTRLFG